MMGQIAVTTNNNKIYAHQLYEQGGKTASRCIMESQVKEAGISTDLVELAQQTADRCHKPLLRVGPHQKMWVPN